jgi:deoxyribose-phosphate aldolase
MVTQQGVALSSSAGTSRKDDFRTEQAYLSRLYQRLDKVREQAAERLRGGDVRVSTIVSFPHGADLARAKIAAAETCVAAGADEVDVVMNVGAMLSGAFRRVQDELAGVVRAVSMRSANRGRGGVLVKVVIETAALDDKLKRLACKIVEDSGADFAVVAPGDDGAAPLHDVELLRECLSERVGVKATAAATGVDEVYELVNAGAARIGTTDGVGIMRDVAKRGQ